MKPGGERYVHALLLQHLHVHLLDGQRHAHPVVHQLAQSDLRMTVMRCHNLLQQELRLFPAGERVAHLHLDLLAGGGRTLDISPALLHPHDLANELCSLLLQEHLQIKKKRGKATFPSEMSSSVFRSAIFVSKSSS